MRIIIFTDSLGRPRPDLDVNNKTEYEDVYGYKLKDYFSEDEIELIYIESLDTQDAIFWSQRMVAFRKPDLVIFQLGINDCVPRLFKKNSSSIILNQIFRKVTFDFFLKVMSYFRFYITKVRPIVYIDKDSFRKNFHLMISEIQKYSSNVQFITISIAKSDVLNKKSSRYNKNILDYNKILKNIFNKGYIEINDLIDDEGFISDFIHINKNSHDKLFHVLKEKIEEIKKCVE